MDIINLLKNKSFETGKCHNFYELHKNNILVPKTHLISSSYYDFFFLILN